MIGNKIREIRLTKNMSVRQAAEAIGINHSHLSRIETGKVTPNLGTLEKIANVLGVNIKEFYEDDEETIDRFSVRLINELLDEGIITDVDNIPQETFDLIIAAFKRDIRRIKNNK